MSKNVSVVMMSCVMAMTMICNVPAQAADKVPHPVMPLPFSDKELLSKEMRDTYTGDNLTRVAFPMGGIGTGCISLAGNGELVDWEIFNHPNKGFRPKRSFLSAEMEVRKELFEAALNPDLRYRKIKAIKASRRGRGH